MSNKVRPICPIEWEEITKESKQYKTKKNTKSLESYFDVNVKIKLSSNKKRKSVN